ncbi:MAG: T9SS type A sorting domain-containing protein [Bacteroidota bacterium]
MKNITFFFSFLSFCAFSQSFNQGNEASIGNLVSLHICDSNANILAGTIGNNVTWDFSQIAGIFGVTKDVQINDATLDPNFASYPGASKVYDIGGTLLTFFSSTANDRTSQGFVFNEPALGVVTAAWSTNDQLIMNYPFALGNSTSDNFSGNVTTTATGTIPATGASMTSVDGLGTLMLPGNNTYSNVVRFHLKDSANASVFGSPVTFIRDVYEYYDFTVGNLPVFITMTVTVNSPLFANSSTLVLSKDLPTTFVGLNEHQEVHYGVYPNPVNTEIHVEGLNNGAEYQIMNSLGQTVLSGNYWNSIDVTNLSRGLYYVYINGQVLTVTK